MESSREKGSGALKIVLHTGKEGPSLDYQIELLVRKSGQLTYLYGVTQDQRATGQQISEHRTLRRFQGARFSEVAWLDGTNAVEEAEAVQGEPDKPKTVICKPDEVSFHQRGLQIPMLSYSALSMEDTLVWLGQAGRAALSHYDAVRQQEVRVAGRILVAINGHSQVDCEGVLACTSMCNHEVHS